MLKVLEGAESALTFTAAGVVGAGAAGAGTASAGFTAAAGGGVAAAGGGGGLDPPMLREIVGAGRGASVASGRSIGGGRGCCGGCGGINALPGTNSYAPALSLFIVPSVSVVDGMKSRCGKLLQSKFYSKLASGADHGSIRTPTAPSLEFPLDHEPPWLLKMRTSLLPSSKLPTTMCHSRRMKSLLKRTRFFS